MSRLGGQQFHKLIANKKLISKVRMKTKNLCGEDFCLGPTSFSNSENGLVQTHDRVINVSTCGATKQILASARSTNLSRWETILTMTN